MSDVNANTEPIDPSTVPEPDGTGRRGKKTAPKPPASASVSPSDAPAKFSSLQELLDLANEDRVANGLPARPTEFRVVLPSGDGAKCRLAGAHVGRKAVFDAIRNVNVKLEIQTRSYVGQGRAKVKWTVVPATQREALLECLEKTADMEDGEVSLAMSATKD